MGLRCWRWPPYSLSLCRRRPCQPYHCPSPSQLGLCSRVTPNPHELHSLPQPLHALHPRGRRSKRPTNSSELDPSPDSRRPARNPQTGLSYLSTKPPRPTTQLTAQPTASSVPDQREHERRVGRAVTLGSFSARAPDSLDLHSSDLSLPRPHAPDPPRPRRLGPEASKEAHDPRGRATFHGTNQAKHGAPLPTN